MSLSVLVVAAHPDDEILGCGGTIARHVQEGASVTMAILGEGSTSRASSRDLSSEPAEVQDLRRASEAAAKILGVHKLECFGLPDNRMDSLDLLDVVKIVEQLVDEHRPQLIYTHAAGDVNLDHGIVHRAVYTAARPLPESPTHTLLAFETVSSSEWTPPNSQPAFLPNFYVDITSTIELKRKALEAYSQEMRSWPHPRSIEAIEHLARWRGATVGLEAAECFMMLRGVCKPGSMLPFSDSPPV